MAVQTRFGSVVTIVSRIEINAQYQSWVTVEYCDGARRTYPLWELRADGGIQEIEAAAAKQTDLPAEAALRFARKKHLQIEGERTMVQQEENGLAAGWYLARRKGTDEWEGYKLKAGCPFPMPDVEFFGPYRSIEALNLALQARGEKESCFVATYPRRGGLSDGKRKLRGRGGLSDDNRDAIRS